MQTVKQVLIEAKAKLAMEENWNKGYRALTHDRKEVEPTSPRAYCFCAIGALEATRAPSNLIDEAAKLLTNSVTARGFTGKFIWAYNDHPDVTYEDVLRVFDKAIEKCNNSATGTIPESNV